ncbi:hypothetical protein GCM10020331_016790 [Ectobacillus funiculus]
MSATFFSFAVIGFVAIAFVKKYLPETKGRTLEELEHYFRTYDNRDTQNDLNTVGASAKVN